MKLVAVNIGKVVEQPWRDGTPTAINKETSKKRILLTEEGLQGDEQADRKNHGGHDKAVLVLPSSTYMRFEIEHPYGFLGDNLTLEGIDESEVCLGDRFQIGTTLLEVSQPRSPCWKLDQQVLDNRRWKQGDFLKAYSDSGHVGFYCRVLGRGTLKKGQQVIWLTRNGECSKVQRLTIRELFLAKYFQKGENPMQILEQAARHPSISKAWKTELLKLLEAAK